MKLSYLERSYVNSTFRNRIQRPLEFSLFRRMAPFPQGAHVLEVGCGNGDGLAYIARHFNPASLTGIELDATQANLARQRLAHLKIPVTILTGSATQIPLPAHGFDIILCIGVLHHIPEWRRTVAEFARLLRNGGLVYNLEFYTPLLNLPLIRKLAPHASTGITRASLKASLSHHGFTQLGTSPAPASLFRKWLGNRVSLQAARLAITQPEYD